MNIRPDFHRTEAEAGCEWMRLIERSDRAARGVHWLLAGVGIGMIAAAQIINILPRIVP